MKRSTIIAACVGAFAALAVAYTMNSTVFAATVSPDLAGDTPARHGSSRTLSPLAVLPAIGAAPAHSGRAIRAGQLVGIKIGTHVSSRDAKVGDPVEAVTTEDISVNGLVAIASGTRVTGTVTEVSSARTTKSAAVLGVRFTRIGGHQVRLALASPDLVVRARNANRAADAALVAGGAVAGGVIGNQVSHRGGTEIGAVAGAVVGGVTAANLGANVQLKLGEAGQLRFEEDLVIN